MAALLAPFLSIVTFSETPLAFLALSKKAQGCSLARPGSQQKINCLALLVHRAAKVFPGTLDLEISLVRAPVATHRVLVFAEHFFKQGQKPDRPAID